MKIFLTVGSRFPMDRLVKLVDEFIQSNSGFSCIAQVGNALYHPKNFETFKTLKESQFIEYAENSDVIISHAGMGNILLAAELQKPIIVMARKASLKEHINDHQLHTTVGLKQKSFINVISDQRTLINAMQWAKKWQPEFNETPKNNELQQYIAQYLNLGQQKNILAISSAGGHWTQLKLLISNLDDYDISFITTDMNMDTNVKNNSSVLKVKDADKTKKLKLLVLSFQIFFHVLRLQPQVVISTGAAPGFFAIFFAKLLRKKTIWVDSMANYETISLSGKYAKNYCDVFLVQWPHLADDGFYQGSII